MGFADDADRVNGGNLSSGDRAAVRIEHCAFHIGGIEGSAQQKECDEGTDVY